MGKHHDDQEPTDAADERCVPTRAASEILGVSDQTLNQWRLRGQGPAFRRFGKLIRYQIRDLRDYMARCRVGGAK